MPVGDLHDHGQRIVERAVDLNDLGAISHCAGQFPRCDLALRDQHNGLHPGPGGVGCGGSGRIARRSADDRFCSAAQRLADRRGHAAILE